MGGTATGLAPGGVGGTGGVGAGLPTGGLGGTGVAPGGVGAEGTAFVCLKIRKKYY